MSRPIETAEREFYERDGVALLKGFLSQNELARLEQAFDYTLSHPGPCARTLYPDDDGRFYQDGSNMVNWDYYANALRSHPLPDACRSLWNAEAVWLMNEQIFLKKGGRTRRTPWHQDASYTPYDGQQLAIMWVNFDSVTLENSLEFVRGSHKGPLYSGSAFDPADDTLPLTPSSSAPRMPDIQRQRDQWDLVSFVIEPGDVVVFHNRTLHGGGGTSEGMQRRTLSLRFFGADVIRTPSEEPPAEDDGSQLDASLMSGWGGLVRSLVPGQPLSSNPAFKML